MVGHDSAKLGNASRIHCETQQTEPKAKAERLSYEVGKNMKSQIEVGKTYSVRYPFVLEDVLLPPDDPEATQMLEVKSWRPGVKWEQVDEERADACADAFGEMLLTVVDVHKPGRFPTRVFYTRQWKCPNGKVFGKCGLHITTVERFRRISSCYKHEIWIDGEKQQPSN